MTYPNEIIFDAIALLETVCPEKTLIVGTSLFNVADQYHEHCNVIQKHNVLTRIPATTEINDATLMQRYDLAIIGEILEGSDKLHAEQLIGRLRDLCSPRIILVAKLSDSEWFENELLGFGLSRYAHYEINDDHYILYQYNINSYKRTPDWFNPKSWANPELWNKFWW